MSNLLHFLFFLYGGSTLRRWNGIVSPISFWEVDRQGHKMMVVWLLLKRWCELSKIPQEQEYEVLEYCIEKALLNYCFNLVVTDIKPRIFEQIKASEHYKKLVAWALSDEKLAPLLQSVNTDFAQKALSLLLEKTSSPLLQQAEQLLDIASSYTRLLEVLLLENCNTYTLLDSPTRIRKEIEKKLQLAKENTPCLQELLPCDFKAPETFFQCLPYYFGQLRFQQRWSQIPRLPVTNVLGHSFLVGCYSYILAKKLNFSKPRAVNDFFAGLFHDTPEAFTQDVVNPVKHSSKEIAECLHEYEKQQLEEYLYKPLAQFSTKLYDDLQYLLGTPLKSEFYNTIITPHNTIKTLSFHELAQSEYSSIHCHPKDGVLLKFCDTLSAFLEAHSSIQNGISTPDLSTSYNAMFQDLRYPVLSSYIYEKNSILKEVTKDGTLILDTQQNEEDSSFKTLFFPCIEELFNGFSPLKDSYAYQ